MSEEAILRELSGERARKHVEHITSQFPTRMAGTRTAAGWPNTAPPR